ncbi:MAG: TIGR03643 family protein [Ginsengibacter sp.]
MTIADNLSVKNIDRIIEMAWEDRTTFEAIEIQFGLKQQDVIKLMRKEIKASSFKLWRERTNGRSTKHEALRSEEVNRFKSSRQKTISRNKITKR